jgi:hypothetical protein
VFGVLERERVRERDREREIEKEIAKSGLFDTERVSEMDTHTHIHTDRD